MFYLASTRFNNETYKENIDYRHKKDIKVIYGTCVRIQSRYSLDTILFVIEMNNETNKIEGIGIIRNRLSDNKYKLYSNTDYNRYVYIGEYWMSREQILNSDDPELVEIFDLILFKGKSHMKRQAGISVITKKLLTNWIYELPDLEQRVKSIFVKEFRKNNDYQIIIDIDNYNEINTKEERKCNNCFEIEFDIIDE